MGNVQADLIPIPDAVIRDALLVLLAARPVDASICPSEVARALAGDAGSWRTLMPKGAGSSPHAGS
jgi:hypothetical protein